VGTEHTITATVKADGKPVAGVTVTFTVISGPNVQTFTAMTDANGKASFTYTGTGAGVDTIGATADVAGGDYTSNKARKEWVDEQTTPPKEVFVYPVKFVCGFIPVEALGEASPPPPNEPPVKPGNYATAINLYNFQSQDVKFTKNAVIANPQGQPSGATSPVFIERLGAGLALEVDCSDITKMLSRSEGGVSLPAFIKGFVVVESPVDLQVVAVYTAEKLEVAPVGTPVEIVLNTGFDQSAGTELTDGDPDGDWEVIADTALSTPFDAIVVFNQVASLRWGGALAGSRWISTDANARGTNVPIGTETTYAYEFTLPACVQNPVLELDIKVDQEADVFLNGNFILTASWPATKFTPATVITSSFLRSGNNLLTVVLRETVGVVMGFVATGTVQAIDPDVCIGGGISIDVEYIQPKIVRRVEDPPTEPGHIIVDKVTVPAGDPQSFAFAASYTGGFSLTDAAAPNDSGPLTPGTYSVGETLPAGWVLTSAACSDGSPVGAIVLDPGRVTEGVGHRYICNDP